MKIIFNKNKPFIQVTLYTIVCKQYLQKINTIKVICVVSIHQLQKNMIQSRITIFAKNYIYYFLYTKVQLTYLVQARKSSIVSYRLKFVVVNSMKSVNSMQFYGIYTIFIILKFSRHFGANMWVKDCKLQTQVCCLSTQ